MISVVIILALVFVILYALAWTIAAIMDLAGRGWRRLRWSLRQRRRRGRHR